MEFHVYETRETVKARRAADRWVFTSNNEKGAARRVPAPLLLPLYQASRRETMQAMLDVTFPASRRCW
jgi:hypothetical protein